MYKRAHFDIWVNSDRLHNAGEEVSAGGRAGSMLIAFSNMHMKQQKEFRSGVGPEAHKVYPL